MLKNKGCIIFCCKQKSSLHEINLKRNFLLTKINQPYLLQITGIIFTHPKKMLILQQNLLLREISF